MRIKPRALIGVEFGADSVRIIKTNKKSRVVRSGYAELPQTGGPLEEKDISAALKRAKKAARAGGGKCALCITGPDVILRQFTLPNMAAAALRVNVGHEMENFTGGGDYYVTYKIQSFTHDESGIAQLKVLAAAVLRSKADAQIKLLRAAGFKPRVIDVSENSREKLLNYITNGRDLSRFEPPAPSKPPRGKKAEKKKAEKKPEKKKPEKKKPEKKKSGRAAKEPAELNAAMITFGLSSTDVTIMLGRRFYVSRYLNTGSRDIVRRIAEAEGTDEKEAGEIFKKGGFFGETDESPASAEVKGVLDMLCAEITSVIDYSYYRERRHRVERIYAFGAVTRLKGAAEYLEELFEIPVTVSDRGLSKMFGKKVSDISPFINVLGATLREARK